MTDAIREDAFTFDCGNDVLVGTCARPAGSSSPIGVLIIVGGPQYRAGSHRQFVHLSRQLAAAGIPCMRFDCRGMGDSEGEPRHYLEVSDDIQAAIATFSERCSGVQRVVLWGLCDGATAAALFDPADTRVAGCILANPWVRSEQSEARVYLKHYYLKRLLSASFWRKLLSGGLPVRRSLSEAKRLVGQASSNSADANSASHAEASISQQMAVSLRNSDRATLVILSENDFVAREFEDQCSGNTDWRVLLQDDALEHLESADHTFSNPGAAEDVARLSIRWVQTLRARWPEEHETG